MWRTIFLTVLWSANVFCYNIQFTANHRKIGPNPDLMFSEPFSVNSGEEIIDVKSIYYTTAPKTRVVVEYGDEEFPNKILERDDSSSEEDDDSSENEDAAFQPWSILWYIGSFGGLIAFFLVVSCSEWCCRNHGRNRNPPSVPSSPTPSEAPPPAYDLFAPPSYESLCHNGEKRDFDVYVVPVHTIITDNRALQTNDPSAPPAYYVNTSDLRTNDVPHEVVVNVVRSEEEYIERHKTSSETHT